LARSRPDVFSPTGRIERYLQQSVLMMASTLTAINVLGDACLPFARRKPRPSAIPRHLLSDQEMFGTVARSPTRWRVAMTAAGAWRISTGLKASEEAGWPMFEW